MEQDNPECIRQQYLKHTMKAGHPHHSQLRSMAVSKSVHASLKLPLFEAVISKHMPMTTLSHCHDFKFKNCLCWCLSLYSVHTTLAHPDVQTFHQREKIPIPVYPLSTTPVISDSSLPSQFMTHLLCWLESPSWSVLQLYLFEKVMVLFDSTVWLKTLSSFVDHRRCCKITVDMLTYYTNACTGICSLKYSYKFLSYHRSAFSLFSVYQYVESQSLVNKIIYDNLSEFHDPWGPLNIILKI